MKYSSDGQIGGGCGFCEVRAAYSTALSFRMICQSLGMTGIAPSFMSRWLAPLDDLATSRAAHPPTKPSLKSAFVRK